MRRFGAWLWRERRHLPVVLGHALAFAALVRYAQYDPAGLRSVWIALAAVAVVVVTLNRTSAVADRREVIQSGRDGLYRMIAQGHVEDQTADLAVQAIFLLVGIGSVIPALRPYTGPALVVAQGMLVARSIRGRLRRHAILRLGKS